MAKKVAIEVNQLVTHYGPRKILDGIDLEINEREIMIIMGGSGSGKSTLLRHLLGLHTPTSGTIKLLGTDITTATAAQLYELRRNMGVSFQGGALLSSMTVGENVRLPLREHAEIAEETIGFMARLKLELVNLGGFEHLMPSELSGGMRKRAGFARAIALDPEIVFLDEPTAGLDPIGAAAFDSLIAQLRHALGLTVFMVTHDLDSLHAICDRIAVLAEGRVIAVGTMAQMQDIDHPWVQAYFKGPRARAARAQAKAN